jgi:hypothetical protein
MTFCMLCRKSEDECGPFKSMVKDCILIMEKECCEACRNEYEGKPSTPYEFYYKGEENELGGFRFSGISKNRTGLSTADEAS